MKVLFVSTYYPPDICSTGVIMADIARQLRLRGHEVTVVTSEPHYGGESSPSAPAHEVMDGVEVHRVPVFVPDKSNFRQRIRNYGSFGARAARRALALPRHDVALIPSPPLTNGLVGDLLKLKRTPFIYNVQDVWPDLLVRMGSISEGPLLSTLKRLERHVYSSARRVTVISEGFRANLEAKGVDPGKIDVIPNFFDTDEVTPGPRHNPFRERQELGDDFVVLFGGNVGFSQGLDNVLRAAGILQQKGRDDIRFLIVGEGASKASLQQQAEEMALHNVRFLPFQPYEDLPDMYATADLCLVPLKKGFSAESVPCKVFTIMAAGRPILASVDPDSETADVIHSADAGQALPPEDEHGIAAAIEAAAADPEQQARRGMNGRRYVVAHHGLDRIGDLYEESLAKAAGVEARERPTVSTPRAGVPT